MAWFVCHLFLEWLNESLKSSKASWIKSINPEHWVHCDCKALDSSQQIQAANIKIWQWRDTQSRSQTQRNTSSYLNFCYPESLVTDCHGPYTVHSRVSSSFSPMAPEIQLTNESHNTVTYIIIVRGHTHQAIDMFAIFLKYCLRLLIPYTFVKHYNEFIKTDSNNLILFTYNPRQSRVRENRNHVKQMLYEA